MASNTGGFSHLLQPSLAEIFFNKYSQYPDEYSQIFNILSSEKAYEEDSEVAALGKMVEKTEGTAITYDDPFQAAALERYTHKIFALGFRVTYELYKNDLYGVIKRMPAALARSAHQTVEVESWNILNRAFNTGYLGRDNQSLCSTSHPNIQIGAGSGPYSNRLSTDSDLSVTSLQAAVELLENTTDDRDLNLMLKAKTLIVAPEGKWMARELLNSEYKPHTADNEINALADEELKYMVCHYFSDTDAWFLACDKADHYLKFYWREKPSFANDDDFDTGDGKFKGMEWFSVGFSGYRGIVGTPGA